MANKFIAGSTFSAEAIVTEEMTTEPFSGSGVRVLSTPGLVEILEGAAMEFAGRFIGSDQRSLGISVECSHVAPTPAGMHVIIYLTLEKIDGPRLRFAFQANNEDGEIARGYHERVIVDLQRFSERQEQKKMLLGRGEPEQGKQKA